MPASPRRFPRGWLTQLLPLKKAQAQLSGARCVTVVTDTHLGAVREFLPSAEENSVGHVDGVIGGNHGNSRKHHY